jgi:hypothetical protein
MSIAAVDPRTSALFMIASPNGFASAPVLNGPHDGPVNDLQQEED